MRRNCLISSVLAVGCILFLQIGCQEQAKVTLESKPVLTAPKPVVRPTKAETIPEVKGPAPKITFEKVVHDFGEVGPGTTCRCEFKFTNTGDGLLKIGKIQTCCGFKARLKNNKKEYAPGESGTVIVTHSARRRTGQVGKHQYVYSNDKARPKVTLTIKAKVVMKVDYEPKKLNLLLKGENAGCPEITLRSLDDRPFAISGFKSTANCITAKYDPSVKATKFVLEAKVDIEKLRKGLNGRIDISLTHPECDRVTIAFNVLPEFKITPPSIIIFKAEPQKPITRKVWILNNYQEDFEIESAASEKGLIRVLSQKEVKNGYEFELEITPPVSEDKKRVFTDVFFVNIKAPASNKQGEKLKITCNGFYSRKKKSLNR